MPLSLLRRLLTGNPPANPTADWPVIDVASPVIDLRNHRVGPVKFGDVLGQARVLGQPDSCLPTQPGCLELVYGSAGFRMDFENNVFVYAAFFISPDEFDPPVRTLRHHAPRESSGAQFAAEMSQADLIGILGQPDSIDAADPDDVIVYFSCYELVLEFEFNLRGCLKRWNLYPAKNPAP